MKDSFKYTSADNSIVIRELEESNGYFHIIFKRPENLEEKLAGKTSGISGGLSVAKNVGINVGKNRRLEAILDKIKNNIRFTIKSLAREFKVNEKTIERDLEILKRQNKIIFIGSKKTGSWKIIN